MCSGLTVIPATDGAAVVTYDPYAHGALESALKDHFQYCFQRGHVVWPRGFPHAQRVHFPGRGLLRNEEWSCLYMAPSWCRAGPNHTTRIGNGLFTCVALTAGVRLCTFYGEVVSAAEYAVRVAAGFGGYGISITADRVLDCYSNKANCLASMANSPLNVVSVRTGVPVPCVSNAQLVVDVRSNSASLESTHAIAAHSEVLWPYGLPALDM